MNSAAEMDVLRFGRRHTLQNQFQLKKIIESTAFKFQRLTILK
jgi:hypothetical protein